MNYGPIQKPTKGEDSGKEIAQQLQLALEKSGSLGSSGPAGDFGIFDPSLYEVNNFARELLTGNETFDGDNRTTN